MGQIIRRERDGKTDYLGENRSGFFWTENRTEAGIFSGITAGALLVYLTGVENPDKLAKYVGENETGE